MAETDIQKIAFVGDYPPRKCGIATFTHDLSTAVANIPGTECFIVPVDDIDGGYEYPQAVRFQITEQDRDSYRRAADFLNFSNVDVVSLQHEFGIYGGPGGAHILTLLTRPADPGRHDPAHRAAESRQDAAPCHGAADRPVGARGRDDRAQPRDATRRVPRA